MATIGPLLQTEALHKAFGGLQAVRGADLRVDPGEIRAIIGPNGAGKTTLVGMISGRIRPTSGRVLFSGRDITAAPAHARVALGIVCTFQLTSIYGNLSVYANVALAVQRRWLRSAFDILRPDDHWLARDVHSALEEVGLPAAWDLPAGALPHGHQRLLEMAMALALRPRLLVLDEPTQGLAPDESAALTALIRRIADKVTVLLVEHNLEVVLGLSHRITVMDRGSIVAEGTPGEIEANPDVQRVYLGQ